MILITMLLLLAAPAPGESAIDWEPYVYKTREGATVDDGERGRLVVPERHAAPDGPTLELNFIRFRCTGEECGPPIVWLAGGPGDFGSDDIEGPYLELVRAFQEVGDVIALDQRGTGLSEPLLRCPGEAIEVPLDAPLDRNVLIAAYQEASRACADYWSEQGVDLGDYNTEESADDLESLRIALGVEQLRLYGASYGTHLGLSYLRQHPRQVARAVFSGVEGPDHTWKRPAVIDAHFAAVAAHHAAQVEDGDLLALLQSLREKLEAEPARVPLDDEGTFIVLGDFDLQFGLHFFLGDLDNIRQLPSICESMAAGDFSILAQASRSLRSVSIGSAMRYCMDCASGASTERLAMIAAEAPQAIMGRALNLPFPEVCESWPADDLGDEFRSGLQSDVPVLFLSGELDGHTPPSNVEELIAGFPDGVHVVVDNASHQYLEFAHEEIVGMLRDYLAGTEPDRLRLSAPAVFDDIGTR